MAPRILRSVIQDTWIPECCAIAVSLLSFIMILVLVKGYNNKPIFVWHGATLNTFVSTISTLGKAMLLSTVSACISQWKYIWFYQGQKKLIDFETLDAASRGPSGSVGLLWSIHFRSLVSIGAVITILSLAIDPLLQQIVGIGERQIPGFDSVAIARAVRYSRGITNFNSQEIASGADGRNWVNITTITDFSMQSAILFGLTSSQSTMSQQMTVNCPGAHCEWPPYLSLAICSTCEDVTKQVLSSEPGELKGLTNYILSNGLYTYAKPAGNFTVPFVSYGTTNRSKTVAFQDNQLLIYSLTVMQAHEGATSATDIPILATECSLQYCVNNYTSQKSDGTVFETVTLIPSVVPPTAWTREQESWGPLGSPGTLEKGWAQLQSTGFYFPNLELMDQFSITQSAINSIAQGLSSILAGNEQDGHTGSCDQYGDCMPNSMRLMYNFADLNAMFRGLATSMTNCLRSNDEEQTLVRGTAGITVYHIHLKWIALPLISVFGSAFLLALTIFYTNVRHVPIWKSSALSVMKVRATKTISFDSENSVSGMESKAKKTFVTLSDASSEHAYEEKWMYSWLFGRFGT